MIIETVYFGNWSILVAETVVKISPPMKETIESFLTDRYVPCAMRRYCAEYRVHNYAMARFGVPAHVVRLDMPPAINEFPGVYEVDANVAGLGIAHHLGVPVVAATAAAFNALGVDKLGYGVAPSREDQREDHVYFMQALSDLGIRTHPVPDLACVDDGLYPLWLRAGHEDIDLIGPLMTRCLLFHYHSGGHKGYLYEIDRAAPLTRFASTDAIFEMFPRGFVVKPVGTWGAREVFAYTPDKPWKAGGVSESKMRRVISTIAAQSRADEYLVQAFGRPENREKKRFRIWRVYCVWTGRRFEVIGGFWAQRNSLRVHGARDTVLGPLRV